MAGSNNENLIRTLKKDDCLSPIYDTNIVRPKSVIRKKNNINIFTDINIGDKRDIIKNKKKKFEFPINDDSNSNLISYLKEKDKKKDKNYLLTNYNNNNKSNLINKNFKLFNKNNLSHTNDKKELNIIFPKLKNLNNTKGIKSINSNNDNFKNLTNKIYTEIYKTDFNYPYDELIKEEKRSNKNKRENEKVNLKNYLTKNDFTYFG